MDDLRARRLRQETSPGSFRRASGFLARARIGLEIAERPLDSSEIMLQHRRVLKGIRVVPNGGIEYAAFAVRLDPTDGEVEVSLPLFQDAVPRAHLHLARFDAQQNMQTVAQRGLAELKRL